MPKPRTSSRSHKPRNPIALDSGLRGSEAALPALRPQSTDPDAIIRALAARQYGVVSRAQLLRSGLRGHTIDYRLKKGLLTSIHHGVYRFGPISAPYSREMAALLACDGKAVLSHTSAGVLWNLQPPPHPSTPVTLCSTINLQPRAGVRVYRVVGMGPDEVTEHEGFPITTPSRTLLDLAGILGSREFEQVVAAADRRDLLDRDELEKLLSRYPRRRGNPRLRAVLSSEAGPALTRSEAEERFLDLVRKAGLRPPRMNAVVRGFEVDALWESERLVVEIDGFAYHSSRGAFERDRQRDGVLAAAGFRVMRVTWRQLTREPEVLLVRLARALAMSGRS